MWLGALRSPQETTAIQAPVTITIATAPRYSRRGRPQSWTDGHWVIIPPSTMPRSTRAQSAMWSRRVAASVERATRRALRCETGVGALSGGRCSWPAWVPRLARPAKRRSTSRAIGSGWGERGDFDMGGSGEDWDAWTLARAAFAMPVALLTRKPAWTADYPTARREGQAPKHPALSRFAARSAAAQCRVLQQQPADSLSRRPASFAMCWPRFPVAPMTTIFMPPTVPATRRARCSSSTARRP
jgi:hypothetical protein